MGNKGDKKVFFGSGFLKKFIDANHKRRTDRKRSSGEKKMIATKKKRILDNAN